MAPKKVDKEALRLEIEERIVARAKADDEETKRLKIESRLCAEAQAQDAEIAEAIAHAAKMEAERLRLEQERIEAERAALRLKIEAELVEVARAENAADEARAEAERLRQERADLVVLAPVLNDMRTAAQRTALTACWEEIRALYSSWGQATVRPGQLACGVRLARCGVSPEAVRMLAAQLMGSARGDEAASVVEDATGVDLRLLDVFLRRGGYSELLLGKDSAMAGKLAAAVAAASESGELPKRSPPVPSMTPPTP